MVQHKLGKPYYSGVRNVLVIDLVIEVPVKGAEVLLQVSGDHGDPPGVLAGDRIRIKVYRVRYADQVGSGRNVVFQRAEAYSGAVCQHLLQLIIPGKMVGGIAVINKIRCLRRSAE